MDKNSVLDEIFGNDPFGLLNVKASTSSARNADERLIASFQEICDFYEVNNHEPEQGSGIQEHGLYSRLKGIRADQTKMEMLKAFDQFSLLSVVQKEFASLDDILDDDSLGLLADDSEGLFDYQHIPKPDERAMADFVARRKPCPDFQKYEEGFKVVQKDLSATKRKLILFKEDNLREGDFYVHNGILLLLEKVDFEEEVQPFRSGNRIRKDGRTRIIFENGTESNMLYRSLYKILLANGKAVTSNIDKVNVEFIEKFSNITDEDQDSGLIYILKSKSERPEIKEIRNLYKIGFSKIAVEDRIKNARLEPTYLMADVRIVMVYKCFNMNTQKLEQLLHNFFGKSCLNIDVFDKSSNRHIPREWFIAPLEVIEQAIHLIISGDILNFRYDAENEVIGSR
ncbi:MAG TPA: GIY-YIG nuclease family protein [Prolixibacteraceae bacterium]|nr:GIY-YIG nuclease family protein [Prolixibacteraceae bacterium]